MSAFFLGLHAAKSNAMTQLFLLALLTVLCYKKQVVMPRTAIISDIHANLHALSAVMEDCAVQQCSGVTCVGDIVGYNAYPAECLDYIRKLNCPVVKGNHDAEVLTGGSTRMNPVARQAAEWTAAQLNDDQKQWLARLQFMRIVRLTATSAFTVVHSSLEQPGAWNYIINAHDAVGSFNKQFSPLCFHGHTHIPKIFEWDGRHSVEDAAAAPALAEYGEYTLQLQPGRKYFVNVGSVGQPRDNDPRASYAVYDTDAATVTLRRVEYDVESACRAVEERGLPAYLAERLMNGC